MPIKSLFFVFLLSSSLATASVASIADYLASLIRSTKSAELHSFVDVTTQRFINDTSTLLNAEEKQFIKAILYEPQNSRVVLLDTADFFYHHAQPKTYLMVGKKIDPSEKAKLKQLIRSNDGNPDYKLLAHDLIEKTTTELDEDILDLVEEMTYRYPGQITNDVIKPSLKRDAYDMLITNNNDILFMRIYELDLHAVDLSFANDLVSALRSL